MTQITAHTHDASNNVSLSVDVCNIASLTLQRQKNAFDFQASDFYFETDDGASLYELLKAQRAVKLMIQDPADGYNFFKGTVSVDGSEYDPATGRYSFHALHITKKYYDQWKSLYFANERVRGTAVIDSQPLAEFLPVVTGLPVIGDLPSEGTGLLYWDEWRKVNKDTTRVVGSSRGRAPQKSSYSTENAYTIADFVSDVARINNLCFWVTNDEQLKFKQVVYPASATEVAAHDAGIGAYKESLQSADYDKVVFFLFVAEKTALSDSTGRIIYDYYTYIAVQDKDGIDLYGELPSNFNMSRALDLRVPAPERRERKRVSPVLFDIRKIQKMSDLAIYEDYRQYLFPKTIYSILVDEIVKKEPFDLFYFFDKSHPIDTIEYDLVAETTKFTIRQVHYT